MELWQRWVCISLEDSACLLWVVTAYGVCLLQLFVGFYLGYLVPHPGFDRSAVRNSKGELVFRAFARCFRGIPNRSGIGTEFKEPPSLVRRWKLLDVDQRHPVVASRRGISDPRSGRWRAEGTDVLKWETAA